MKSLIFLLTLVLSTVVLSGIVVTDIVYAQATVTPTCTLTLSSKNVVSGQTTLLTWNTSPSTTQGVITGVGRVPPRDSILLAPVKSTTFRATFSHPQGTSTCAISVTVRALTVPDAALPGTFAPSIISSNSSGLPTPSSSGGVVNTVNGAQPTLVSCIGTRAILCDLCALVTTVQNVINFMIGLSIPIAIGLFAWVGYLFFTSGGDPSVIAHAKRIFKTAFLGFIIAISAWLLVQTILNVLVSGPQYKGWSWNNLRCDAAKRLGINEPIGFDAWLKSLPGVGTSNSDGPQVVAVDGKGSSVVGGSDTQGIYRCESGGSVSEGEDGVKWCSVGTDSTGVGVDYRPSCAPGYTPDNESHGCVNNKTGEEAEINDDVETQSTASSGGVKGGAKAQCADGNTACSVEVLKQVGFTEAQANVMSCIAVTESSGNPNSYNQSSGACGTFQILSRHKSSNWNQSNLHSGSCDSATSCNDAYCNAQAAYHLVQRREERGQAKYGDWTCPGCNAKAQACVDTYDPGN